MVLSVGCGNTADKKTAVKSSPEEIYASSQKAMENVKDLKAKANMDMNLSMETTDESIPEDQRKMDLTMNMLMDMIVHSEDKDNATMSMKTKMDMGIAGENQTIDMDMYSVVEDGVGTAYVNQLGQWYKTTMDISNLEKQIPTDALDTYIKLAKSSEVTETTKVGDKDCVAIKASFDGDAMAEVLESMGTADSLSSLGMNASEVFDGFDMTLYFGEDDNYLYKIDFDMTNMMEKIMESAVATEDVDCKFDGSCKMSVEYFDYGVENKVEVPQEAIDNAVDGSDLGL